MKPRFHALRLRTRLLPWAIATLALANGHAGGSPNGAPSEISLRFNMPKGLVHRYSSTNAISTSQSGSGLATMTQTVESEVKVISADGGKFGIEYRILRLDVAGADKTVTAMLQRMSGSLKGARMSLSVDAFGGTSGMKILTGGTGAEASVLKTVLQSLGSSQAGFLGLSYPKRPVAPGETWIANLDVERSFREMGVDTTEMKGKRLAVRYTLRSVQGSGATKSATIEFSMKGNVEVTRRVNGQPQALRQTIEASGTARVQLSTGMPFEISGSNRVVTSSRGITQTQTMKTSMMRLR